MGSQSKRKKTLVVVSGLERLDQYTYGRNVVVVKRITSHWLRVNALQGESDERIKEVNETTTKDESADFLLWVPEGFHARARLRKN